MDICTFPVSSVMSVVHEIMKIVESLNAKLCKIPEHSNIYSQFGYVLQNATAK